MISTQALIDKFQFAIDNHWGYIWGTAGKKWTAEDQARATREQTVKYGKQWIGHTVADCSGLFSWAFKQLGGYMYHGSNTMYKSYCTDKGPMSKGNRTDGKPMKPGTAVFTGTEDDHGHVGLYIGNGEVIEAKGTKAGVIKSKVTDAKWTFWGELTGVYYGDGPVPVGHPTLRLGDKGPDVHEMQVLLLANGEELPRYGADSDFGNETLAAVRAFQRKHGLAVDGVCGPKTWEALEQGATEPKETFYTVCIHHLDKTQADALMTNYPGSTCTEEKE